MMTLLNVTVSLILFTVICVCWSEYHSEYDQHTRKFDFNTDEYENYFSRNVKIPGIIAIICFGLVILLLIFAAIYKTIYHV